MIDKIKWTTHINKTVNYSYAKNRLVGHPCRIDALIRKYPATATGLTFDLNDFVSTWVKMTEKIFDSAFLARLALALRAVEQEALEADDPQPLDAEDYETIYTAFEESGGDPAAARKQIAATKECRDQAFSQILQFVSNLYDAGPVEGLGDEELKDMTRDAFDATACWMEDVEMHNLRIMRESPLQILLKTHHRLNEAMLDMHDQVLWPLARRISPKH